MGMKYTFAFALESLGHSPSLPPPLPRLGDPNKKKKEEENNMKLLGMFQNLWDLMTFLNLFRAI